VSSIKIQGVSLEYQWWGDPSERPPVLLLHEALGSVRGWGAWPSRLAAALGRRVYAYSRQGFGASDPLEAPLTPDYVQREALDVLPRVRRALQLEGDLVLVGLHDGAAMALVHAGGATLPVEAVAAVTPLVLVDETTRSAVWSLSSTPPALARTQSDQDRTISQWVSLWTSAHFTAWNIDDFLAGITCPVLVARGDADDFTSAAQVERLSRLVRTAEAVHLPGSRHMPHLDKPGALTTALAAFLHRL
jgi:pimeloyl-ACP methyl ester carboxylesterase